jgi:hypothetical protein
MVESATMMRTLVSLLLLLGSLGLPAHGQQPPAKPDLSGTWVFNAHKSSLEVAPPSKMTLQIKQKDPQLQLVRTQAYGDQSDTWKLDITVDGAKDVVQKSPLYTSHSRMYWQGSSLVLDEKIVAGDGTQATDLVTYSLSDDGRTLQAVERQATPGAKPATSTWVYDKQAQ